MLNTYLCTKEHERIVEFHVLVFQFLVDDFGQHDELAFSGARLRGVDEDTPVHKAEWSWAYPLAYR